MNKDRRNRLSGVIDTIADAISELEEIRDEEQDALDSLPESLQYSSKGEMMQEYIDDMESVMSDMENVQESIQEIIDICQPERVVCYFCRNLHYSSS